MSADKSPQFYPISWQDVKERVKAVRPELYEVMNDLVADSPELKLYYARYPYGSMIVDDNAVFNLPYHHKLTPISNHEISNDIRKDLNYHWEGLPLSLILNGSADLFMQGMNKEIQTYAVYGPKTLLALRRVLDPHHSYHAKSIWRMSAGARTPIMIPSISNRTQFDKLRRQFNLKCNKPETQNDHWQIFTELANHSDFPNPWFTELLLFPKQWFEEKKSVAWKLFHRELLSIAWNVSGYTRNSRMIEKIWTNFTHTLRNKRATPYVLALLKHIIEVSLGEAPAYFVSNDNHLSGPFTDIVNVFVNDYKLKKYAPIIMTTNHTNNLRHDNAYISLKHLTHPWTENSPFENLSLISHLRETKYLLQQFLEYVDSDMLQVKDTPFIKLNNIDYTFYHYSDDPFQDLKLSAEAFSNDNSVQKIIKQYNLSEIPRSPKNNFLSSLVKLTAKQ